MKILFVYSDLATGGVQTTIVDFANWLVGRGHEVTLVLFDKGDLHRLLSKKVRVVMISKPPRCFRPNFFTKVRGPLADESFDAVCSFDPQSLWLAALYIRSHEGSVRFLTGVYHPRIYFFRKRDSRIDKLLQKLFDQNVPDRCKFFMNEECRRTHELFFKRSFKEAGIIPVPIGSPAPAERIHLPEKYRIVSIGRLEAFKTYNIYMLDVMEELAGKGFDVRWDVYGDGELKAEMERRIKRKGLEERVSLKGTIPFEDIGKALDGAYAFVGMGLSLIHAGARGVPCIPAICDRGALSYGFVYSLPLYSVGEVLEDEPNRKVSVLLSDLFQMGAEQYQNECRKTAHYCRKYDVDHVGGQLLDVITHQPPENIQALHAPPNLLRELYALALLRAARGAVSRAAYKSIRTIVPNGIAAHLRKRRRARLGERAMLGNARHENISGESGSRV